MGRVAEARALLESSVSIARDLGHRRRLGAALQPLGLAALTEGDYEGAVRALEEAVALAHEVDDVREIAAAVGLLATLRRLQGDLDEAVRLYDECRDLADRAADPESSAIALLNLAMVETLRGRRTQAASYLTRALDTMRGLRSSGLILGALDAATGLAANCGDWDRATALHAAAERHMAATGLSRDRADAEFVARLLAEHAPSSERGGVIPEPGGRLHEQALIRVEVEIVATPASSR
jgi:tetratricopeptide (TPR) repeat protein